jgi:HK97 family phage major capsid protein
MPDSMLKKLEDERNAKLQFVEGLTETALKESRDLSTNELELITRSNDRVKELNGQLSVLSQDVALDEQAQRRLESIGNAVAISGTKPGGVEYRSAGHYLRDVLGSLIGEGGMKAEAAERLKRYHRAAQHVVTDDFTGIFPQAIVGPVINFVNTSRPLVSALGVNGVPSGPSFRRPRLVDPNVATGVGIQANQKDELVSQKFTIESDNVDLSTLGGYVNVARQVIDWGIASMDAIVRQLAARYAYATERAAITEMSMSTSHITLPVDAPADDVLQAIYDGAAMVYNQTAQLPTILAAGPDGWARLGGLTDQALRPVFPFLSPGNANGSLSADSFEGNPVGLRLVVTPGITDKTFWVLNNYALEVYEQTIPPLQVVEPSVLGTQVAYAGYIGMYRPAPNGAVHLSP